MRIRSILGKVNVLRIIYKLKTFIMISNLSLKIIIFNQLAKQNNIKWDR